MLSRFIRLSDDLIVFLDMLQAKKRLFCWRRRHFAIVQKLRGFLQIMFGGKRCLVPAGGVVLDGMYFRCKKQVAYATVVYCTTNGGYYEFESEWVEFYLERGLDVFVWNYRGYSLSEGRPSIEALKEDAGHVFRYVRQELRVHGPIAVHGESLGAVAAVNLATKQQESIAFIVADRAFSSMDSIARYGFGCFSRKMFFWCVNFETEIHKKYLALKCPKVMVSDPLDAVITDLASLKNGITGLLYKRGYRYRLAESLETSDIFQLPRIVAECRYKLSELLNAQNGEEEKSSSAEGVARILNGTGSSQ